MSAGRRSGDTPGPTGRPDAFVSERVTMVAEQLLPRGISDARVLEAMSRVPRHFFVDREQMDRAYDDRPLPIGTWWPARLSWRSRRRVMSRSRLAWARAIRRLCWRFCVRRSLPSTCFPRWWIRRASTWPRRAARMSAWLRSTAVAVGPSTRPTTSSSSRPRRRRFPCCSWTSCATAAGWWPRWADSINRS